MTTHLDPTLLPALDAIYGALGARPAVRRYAPAPAVDPEVANFKRLCSRDQMLRDELAERDEEAERAMGGQDFDTWSELNMGANDGWY